MPCPPEILDTCQIIGSIDHLTHQPLQEILFNGVKKTFFCKYLLKKLRPRVVTLASSRQLYLNTWTQYKRMGCKMASWELAWYKLEPARSCQQKAETWILHHWQCQLWELQSKPSHGFYPDKWHGTSKQGPGRWSRILQSQKMEEPWISP